MSDVSIRNAESAFTQAVSKEALINTFIIAGVPTGAFVIIMLVVLGVKWNNNVMAVSGGVAAIVAVFGAVNWVISERDEKWFQWSKGHEVWRLRARGTGGTGGVVFVERKGTRRSRRHRKSN